MSTTLQNPPPAIDIATKMASIGAHVILFPRGQKGTRESGWQDKATRDVQILTARAQQEPFANVGVVAKPDGLWFFDDDGNILEEYEREHGSIDTYRVRSVSGGTHLYFKQNDLSRATGNLNGVNEAGEETWSARILNRYVVSAGSSAYPNNDITKPEAYYTAVDKNAQVVEAPDEFIAFLKARAGARKSKTQSTDGKKIVTGGRNNYLTSYLGKLRQTLELNEEQLLFMGRAENEKSCVPPLDDSEVQTIAHSMAGYAVKKERELLINGKPVQVKTVDEAFAPQTISPVAPPVEQYEAPEPEGIPAFDDNVITGIFREVVDVATAGTTMPRQFSFLVAKTFAGAKLSAGMTFEGISGDSAMYGTVIGQTGTGKHLAWERVVEKVLVPKGVIGGAGIKIYSDVDSGAGLRDSFFDTPADNPVLLYIDEVENLGNKSGSKKNPEILDTIIILADSTTITRMKAKVRGAKKNENSVLKHDNAHLSILLCGQDGAVYRSSFAGKTKVGLWDRFYPEFSEPVEAGELPDIDKAKALAVLGKFYALPLSGHMTMDDDVKAEVESFWAGLPVEVRTKPRFKKHLMLDMYFNAWANERMQARLEDLDVAIRIFQRQLVIREKNFKGEIPDRIGHYFALLKEIVEGQRLALNKHGGKPNKMAMSLRDYQTNTNAFRDNEVHTFMSAWRSFNETYLTKVMSRGANGQLYEKFLPMPEEHETWLPEEQVITIKGREVWVVVV